MVGRVVARWQVALAVALVGAGWAPAVQADWLQAGVDAQRTGYTDENGPAWSDVAYTLALNVSKNQEPPVSIAIVAGKAYVGAWKWPSHSTIYEIELGTAQWREFARPIVDNPLSAGPNGGYETRAPLEFASDGVHFFALFDPGEVQAFDLSTGDLEWKLRITNATVLHDATWPVTNLDPGQPCRRGSELALANGTLYVACDINQSTAVAVSAINITAGRLVWTHVLQAAGALLLPTPSPLVYPTGLSILGEVVVVATYSGPQAGGTTGTTAVDLEAAASSYHALLRAGRPVTGVPEQWVGHEEWWAQGPRGAVSNWPPPATGNGVQVFLELERLILRDAGNTSQANARAVPFRPVAGAPETPDPGSGFVLAPEGLYATSQTGIHRLDEGYSTLRSWTLPLGSQWAPGPLVRTGNGIILGRTGPAGAGFLDPHPGLQALEAVTLRPLWNHYKDATFAFAVSDGLAVLWSYDGVLQVLGANEVSLQPVLRVSSRIPQPGDVVRVDLSRSHAGTGSFGPPTEFKANWGDETETDWQASPIFEHRFLDSLDADARFFIRNANQTSSQAVLFRVGGDPDLTYLQQQFSQENQERTFFFLGLVLTALGAVFGFWRLRAKRGRLQEELDAITAAYERNKDNATACEAALAERRAHAHGLAVDGKLDEGQVALLERRIEELLGRLRLGAVDARLHFLPYGMVLTLQQILKDGQINAWEHRHFIEALDGERLLAAGQKKEVRTLIDSWFRKDAGAMP